MTITRDRAARSKGLALLLSATALASPAFGGIAFAQQASAPAGDSVGKPVPPASTPAAAPAAPAPAPQAMRAQRILVEGNERIESSTIVSYLPFSAGEVVDAARFDLGVKTLFRTDLFSDVRIEQRGEDVVVRVVENPIINQVVFEGNSALADDKLRDEISIHPRGIFTKSHVLADVQRIVELYRRSGRISATVTPKIVELPQKRVDLVFEVVEGPKTGITSINFIGNKAFSDNALRDVVVTKETRWYRFFSSNDNFDPDRIEYDREQLRKYYTNKGYYDFRVTSSTAELLPDQKSFAINYVMDEGPKYKFGKLRVETDLKRMNGDVLQSILPIRSGQIFQADRIETAVDSLTFAAGAAGFAFVDIRPRYTANAADKTVDVTFNVREGPRVYIERIDIIGNTQTQDAVIRREMRLSEGDAYNRVLVDRSKIEVKRLDFFKTVDVDQVPGSAPDKTVLRVKVQEQPTGELSFGAGYSSVDQLLLDVGVSQHNFRGSGQDVRIRASVGSLRRQLDFSYTEPRFGGRDLRAGLDLFSYRYNFSQYAGFDSESTGGSLRLGFPLNIQTYLRTRYQLHTDRVVVDDASCALGATSITICQQRGSSITSAVGYTLDFDKRNDPIHPTRGFFLEANQDFAGLGGDVKYIKTEGQASIYHGFSPRWVLSATGSIGYITPLGGDSVRINDRFFKGGSTFPGFETAGIGPRDTSYDEALGAKFYSIGSLELTVPNYLPEQYGIRTSLFTYAGTIGQLDSKITKDQTTGLPLANIRDDLALRASAGLSVFWTSPLGPIRLDFSQILAKQKYDKTEAFRFSTNTQF
ncbi:outer membrane protein assembly factor BamA [soil metagenome]